MISALATRRTVLAAAAVLSVAGVARADPEPQRNAAEMLDADATSLMQQHRYAEACPKLAESNRLEPGTGVLLRLGLCYETIGRTASAWSAFREAAARAQRSGDESVRQLATKRADGLERRVPKVIVRAATETAHEAVELRCDGALLDRAAIGSEIPLDPGTHTVDASLAGHRSFHATFAVAAGDPPRTILLDLPAESAHVGAPQGHEGTGDLGARREVALVAGGVGIAGIVVGSVLGLVALSTWNRARSECTGGTTGCSQDALSLQSVVNRDALWSTVGFVGGAAALAGGVILWWTAPKAEGVEHGACIVVPVVGENRLGVGLQGRF